MTSRGYWDFDWRVEQVFRQELMEDQIPDSDRLARKYKRQ